LPINLNRINLSSSIRGTEASLTGNFYSGDGQAQLNGEANWQGVPYINLSLAGERLLIRQAPMLTARVTPKIEARILPTEKQLSVNGTIDVPSAVISMPQSSEDIIAKSGDVRVVRSDQIDERVMKAARPWAINADIDVTLGDNIYFRGFGTSIPLGGKLNLSQRGLNTAMRGTGAIGVRQNVTIEAFGQRLQLNRGIARFNGIITQPSLDIDATKSVSNRTIGVRVTGRATNPSIAVYNDAGLSEQEALNALLTGRISSANPTVNNTAGFKSEVNNTIAAAGISLGLGGTRNFTNRIGRTFGLDSLTLDAEGVGDDTQVSLTGYITPDLYLRYGVGVFTPVNRLTLRYQLNRRLYVEASSALDRAVDMFYNWRF
jgi:translocation and assembly module TamB